MLKPSRLITTICIMFLTLSFGIGITNAQTSAAAKTADYSGQRQPAKAIT